MALRRRRRAKPDDDRVLPLINIVFLLLIFFMIAGQITRRDLFEITPPETETSGVDATEEPLILVAADGRMALGGAALEEAALLAELRALATTRDQGLLATVRLKADARADAAQVARLLQTLKQAGVGTVRLVTAAR